MELGFEIEQRFWNYLIEKYAGCHWNDHHKKAVALFEAIQASFEGCFVRTDPGIDIRWMTDRNMVGLLAACAVTALEHDQHEEIDWHRFDNILERTFDSFVYTLVIAIRRGGTKILEGRTFFRNFVIPDWFISIANQLNDEPEFYEKLEDYRAIHAWKRDPSLASMLPN
jgi:hypothetical protein